MLLFDKPIGMNRIVIILISEHIYDNKSKLNFLSTCKFMYSIVNEVYFYQRIHIYNKSYSRVDLKSVNDPVQLAFNNKLPWDDTEKSLSLNIIKRFTNIYLNYENFSIDYTSPLYKLIFDLKLFDNVTYLKMSVERYQQYSNKIQKISHLPPKLIKLKLLQECELDAILPKTLQVLHVNNKLSILFFPLSLKRLTVNGLEIDKSNISTLNLKYLNFLSHVEPDFIFHKLPHGLETLILHSYVWHNSDQYYYDPNINKSLLQSIKYLSLGYPFKKFKTHHLKQIIPKNITHLECYYNDPDIFYECSSLTKIIISKFSPNLNKMKISQNITSISYKYKEDCSSNDYTFRVFLTMIPKTVRTLSFHKYQNSMVTHIPVTIVKLKVYYCWTCAILPDTIQKLYIKNLESSRDKLLNVGPNLKKLSIKYNERYLLDQSVYNRCVVVYRY